MRISFNRNLVWVVFLVTVAALSRLLSHPANVTPVAAIALFSGAFVAHRGLSVFIPFLALFISDLFLGFHPDMPAVYIGMLAAVWIGSRGSQTQAKGRDLFQMGSMSLAASTIFFVITNFSVWMTSGIYEKSLKGLTTCYALALPFFHRSLLGDFFFTVVLFVAYGWVSSKSSKQIRAKSL